ncbi:hypothetical protein J6590_033548 [Homalodisca vitripennis]|nr:hypothetical protein J6590_033548 [Homalodisca vitripennis]
MHSRQGNHNRNCTRLGPEMCYGLGRQYRACGRAERMTYGFPQHLCSHQQIPQLTVMRVNKDAEMTRDGYIRKSSAIPLPFIRDNRSFCDSRELDVICKRDQDTSE